MTEQLPEAIVQEAEEVKPAPIKCAIVSAIREDGSVFIELHGHDHNLITLEGLVKYAERYVSEQWASKTQGEKNNA